MSQILATFKFRKPLSGIGNLLKAVNQLLDSGFYRVRSPLNPLHPKHLYLEVFQSSKSNHHTLKLDLPLVCESNEIALKALVHQIETSKFIRFVSSDDESISFVTGLISETTDSCDIISDSQQYVLQHTFEIRKQAPGLNNLLGCISYMANQDENHLIYAFDSQTNRCLQLNLFTHGVRHPFVVCSRKLKTLKKSDRTIVSQINLASSYGSHISLHYDEESSSIGVYVSEPSDSDAASRMRLALSQLQQLQ